VDFNTGIDAPQQKLLNAKNQANDGGVFSIISVGIQ
jgi:hypothetical protein